MRTALAVIAALLVSASVQAQSATLTWTAPDNTVTAAEAQGLTYTLYVNNGTGVAVTGATCTGASAFSCTAPVPAGVSAVIGTKLELTASSGTSEGPRSIPFISPPTAPTNVKRR